MFDIVHKRKRVVQIIIVIATLPFLFWGIESYRNTDGEDYVAVVSGEKIHRQEFDQASTYATRVHERDPWEIVLTSPCLITLRVRVSVLESLIQQRLLNR